MMKVFKDYDFILQVKFLDEVSKYISKSKPVAYPGEVGFKVNNRYIKVSLNTPKIYYPK